MKTFDLASKSLGEGQCLLLYPDFHRQVLPDQCQNVQIYLTRLLSAVH